MEKSIIGGALSEDSDSSSSQSSLFDESEVEEEEYELPVHASDETNGFITSSLV